MMTNKDFIALTDTFERGKTTAVYKEDRTFIDTTTGEVLKESHESVNKTSTEPDYIKLYYKTMMTFHNIDDIPVNIVLSIADNVSWTNDGAPMLFRNDKITKERICEACGIKESMYYKYINKCRLEGILFPTKYRGVFEVNPFLDLC